MTSTGLADHCEEQVNDFGLHFRNCLRKGLTVNVHPGTGATRVMCMQHSQKAYASGWVVDWDATKAAFNTGRPQDKRADGIDRGQW